MYYIALYNQVLIVYNKGGELLENKNKTASVQLISERCRELFNELKTRRKHRYIIYRIGEEEIDVELVGERKEVFTTHFH